MKRRNVKEFYAFVRLSAHPLFPVIAGLTRNLDFSRGCLNWFFFYHKISLYFSLYLFAVLRPDGPFLFGVPKRNQKGLVVG